MAAKKSTARSRGAPAARPKRPKQSSRNRSTPNVRISSQSLTQVENWLRDGDLSAESRAWIASMPRKQRRAKLRPVVGDLIAEDLKKAEASVARSSAKAVISAFRLAESHSEAFDAVLDLIIAEMTSTDETSVRRVSAGLEVKAKLHDAFASVDKGIKALKTFNERCRRALCFIAAQHLSALPQQRAAMTTEYELTLRCIARVINVDPGRLASEFDETRDTSGEGSVKISRKIVAKLSGFSVSTLERVWKDLKVAGAQVFLERVFEIHLANAVDDEQLSYARSLAMDASSTTVDAGLASQFAEFLSRNRAKK